MIITVTLNPSIDKAYFVDEQIALGKVMRVKKVINTAGGKGVNVAKIINLCGENVLATGLIGGFNGKYLKSLLCKERINNRFLTVKVETRSCINVINDSNFSTEFLESGDCISKKEETSFLRLFEKISKRSSIVTISGSAIKGFSDDIYCKLINIAKHRKNKVILDTSGVLLSNSINAKPTVLKPNKQELEQLFNTKIHGIEDAKKYSFILNDKGIDYVVTSLGKDGALLTTKEGVALHATPPTLQIINTVGCGDSLVGAFAVGLKRNLSIVDTLKYAVAVASANALTENTGNFDKDKLSDVLSKVTVKNIN